MGIDKYIVFSLADLLGSIEDFDGLVSSLEDYSDHESLALLGL